MLSRPYTVFSKWLGDIIRLYIVGVKSSGVVQTSSSIQEFKVTNYGGKINGGITIAELQNTQAIITINCFTTTTGDATKSAGRLAVMCVPINNATIPNSSTFALRLNKVEIIRKS